MNTGHKYLFYSKLAKRYLIRLLAPVAILTVAVQATANGNPSLRFAELSDVVQQRSTLKRVGPDAESACGGVKLELRYLLS